MDGIDVALVKTDGRGKIEFGPTLAVDYPAAFRRRIEAGLLDVTTIQNRSERPGITAELEHQITQRHAQAVAEFLKSNAIDSAQIDMLGFHGQTVLHRPETELTVQLGDGNKLATMTGIDVVYDMRAADMKSGGQGAPLVPVFHQALARQTLIKQPVCFVNIGGISNISYVEGDVLVAFDCGPGNALIDQWVQAKGGIPYDQGGRIGSEGSIIQPVVDRYLKSEFFSRSGPKSLDRADFKPLDAPKAELSDGARTLAHVTARSIYKSVEHLPKPPATWVLCGGGRLNETIVEDLKALAAHSGGDVILCEEAGLEGDMLEAQAFAYLAVRSQINLPLTFPATTGCKEPTRGGVFAPAASLQSK